MKDNINPSHYRQGSVECIDALDAATINKKGMDAICTANIIKYLWRCEEKGGLEDLKKAQWYLSKMIEHNSPKEEFIHPSSVYASEPQKVTSFTQDPLWSKL
jgi:hypothetical protein